METRINISQLEPNAYKAMLSLEKYLSGVQLNSTLKELIKIRASQINGCAYCIQIHTEQATKHGESEQRIYALSAWKESPLFSDQERAVLAVTDEVTLIAGSGHSKETHDLALEHLGEKILAQCIMQIVTINAWNRITVSTHLRHK